MRNEKKSAAEKRATRNAQNERARQRKALEGLRRVSLWAPIDGLEQAQDATRYRVGVVIAEEGADLKPAVYLRKKDGAVVPVGYTPTLFQDSQRHRPKGQSEAGE